MFRTQPGLRAVNLKKTRLLDRVANVNPVLAAEIRQLKLNWYAIRNEADTEDGTGNPAPGAAEVYIYDEIGGSFGVGAQDFIDELNAITADEITVRINSPGGMLIDAIAIGSAIQQHPSNIIGRVDGIAASAATVIAIACDRLEMMPGSQMMVHDVMVDVSGNASDLADAIDWLNEQSRNVANMYAAKSGGTPEEWRNLMLAETWMFAEEAVESRLADAVFTRAKKDSGGKPPMPPNEGDEEDPSEGTPTEEDSPDEEEEPSNSITDEALSMLMSRKHRLTNRGYKYLGRDKAPAPAIDTVSDQELDKYVSAFSKILG